MGTLYDRYKEYKENHQIRSMVIAENLTTITMYPEHTDKKGLDSRFNNVQFSSSFKTPTDRGSQSKFQKKA